MNTITFCNDDIEVEVPFTEDYLKQIAYENFLGYLTLDQLQLMINAEKAAGVFNLKDSLINQLEIFLCVDSLMVKH